MCPVTSPLSGSVISQSSASGRESCFTSASRSTAAIPVTVLPGRVTQESGSEKGHESTTTTAQTSEVTVKDREPTGFRLNGLVAGEISSVVIDRLDLHFGGHTVPTTRATTTETKRIAVSDRTVTAEMGSVTAGKNDGILETNGIKADVKGPDLGKTDQKTDLHHRADKGSAEFDPAGYDFQWLGKYGLESAIRVDAVKTDRHIGDFSECVGILGTALGLDRSSNVSIAVDDLTFSGVSNVHHRRD